MKNKVLAGILLGGFILIALMEGLPQRAANWLKSEQNWASLFSKETLQQSLPGPLLGPLDLTPSELTRDGVIEQTNKQREQNGGTALHMNEKLNLAARAKLDDMFRQQYFEHESPDGKTPADLIGATGYEYLVVGENLALGNFANDTALVEAWMNSPGHRANILDGKFNEIGVAVGKNIYQGREVWMAVQEFGSPLSNCPSPSEGLKAQIETNRTQIQTWEAELAQKKQTIDDDKYHSRSAYNQAVSEYNELAKKLNGLVEDTKGLVNHYNQEVNSFNQCLEDNA